MSKELLDTGTETGAGEHSGGERVDGLAWLAFDAFAPLLRAAQMGEQAALERFCAGVRPLVLEFISRHVSPARAEDITQDIMMRIGRTYNRIAPGDCGQFIITIARNETRRERRRLARSPAVLMQQSEPLEHAVDAPSSDGPADALAAHELSQTVEAACLRLPTAAMRRLAVAAFVHGLDRSDLASEFGVSTAVLRARLFRVRELLREDAVLVSYLYPDLNTNGGARPTRRPRPHCNQHGRRLFQPPPSSAQFAS